MFVVLIGYVQGIFVFKVEVVGDKVNVICEIDGGLQIVVLNLLVIVIIDLCLNELCYVLLLNIMKVKKKLLDVVILDVLGVFIVFIVKILKVEVLVVCFVGIKVKFVVELVEKLKNEVKVI